MRILIIAVLVISCRNDDPKANAKALMTEGKAEPANATKMIVKKYAFEAFPAWAAEHPDKACPSKLSELDKYIGRDNMGTNPGDAWGNTLSMFCGASLPPGAKGLAVLSPGADGKEGTADDVKSWE